jgi:hypothetical protein
VRRNKSQIELLLLVTQLSTTHKELFDRNPTYLIPLGVRGVRVEGLEPPCLAAPDPKSGMSTNFTTPAEKFQSLTSSKVPGLTPRLKFELAIKRTSQIT